MADGSLKNIEDFEVGDRVQTLFGEDEVVNLWNYIKPTYTLELENGDTLECSPEHKFLVDTEEGQIWVQAEDLTELDTIIQIWSVQVAIKSLMNKNDMEDIVLVQKNVMIIKNKLEYKNIKEVANQKT